MAFHLRAMTKLVHRSVLYQELRVKGIKCFDVMQSLNFDPCISTPVQFSCLLQNRTGLGLKLPTPIPFWLQRIKFDFSRDQDKVFLLGLKMMLKAKCLGVAFCLRSMPKLDYLDVLFQELLVEGSRYF